MELDRVSVILRPRAPWEAIDLGLVMARRWWLQVFIVWALPAGITFLLLSAIFPQHKWLAPLVVWWLKPLWDRGSIHTASRLLFGETVVLTEVLRQLPRIYRRELLASLTWRRLSLTRSFDLPVTQLEGLTGAARADRIQVLHLNSAGAASGLTLVCVHIESFFASALYGLMYWLIPSELDPGFTAFATWAGHAHHLTNSFVVLSFCLIGPFYAVSGFALYINRRVELEAWDVELRFRHLAARLKPRQPLKTGASLVLVLLFASLSWPGPTHADSPAPPRELSASQMEAVEVLSQPPFTRMKTASGWRLKSIERELEPPAWIAHLEGFFRAIANFSQAASKLLADPIKLLVLLLWAAFAALVIWFLARYRSAIRNIFIAPSAARQSAAPAVMFGLDVSRDSLPADVPTTALEHWRKGECRLAVSLLYRALLSRLLHDQGLVFHDSHTEGECVDIIRAHGQIEVTGYAEQLTRVWQGLAYGHRMPPAEQLEALCRGWDEVFRHAR